MLSAIDFFRLKQRQRRADHCSLVRRTLHVETPAKKLHAFPHPVEPEMSAHLQSLKIESSAIVGNFDNELSVGPGHRYALIAATAVAKTIGQRFLQQPEQSDSYRQRCLTGDIGDCKRDLQARFSFVVVNRALNGISDRKPFDFRELQAPQDGAQIGKRGLEDQMERTEILCNGGVSSR